MTQDKQAAIFDSFLAIVKAPYGDFSGIGKLSKEINDDSTLEEIVNFLRQSPQGERAFKERLHELPKNTLGYIYSDMMLKNNLKPVPVERIEDNDFSYLKIHLSETHDIWHIVTDSDIDKSGEVKLETFYVAQLHYDRLFLSLLSKNLLKTAIQEMELCESIMDALTKGWTMGKKAKPLFGIQWNSLWEKPLEDIRLSLDIAV
ncbi:Coq4 family protein [Planktothrix agardhii 1807]|uniref:Coq4 family protein n=1 Tax=Planktothrix agardhii TaxID=1160 RepID=UPI001F1969B3|nr:Coq4 family protein [Planktothrix agardhii]MCF3569171.1 Coq4 family protein [Planktothrix agardhii 1807]